jgi:hypothetical protein
MSALSIQPTYPIFTETDGLPLENGYIWIGAANLDPQGNPINVYWDAALTIPAAQPIRTLNGYPSRNGTPGRLYVNSDYSIRVQNSKGSMVYSAPAATERYSADLISYQPGPDSLLLPGPLSISAALDEITDDETGSTRIGFLRSGPDAVARTVKSRLDDCVSVFDYMTPAQIANVSARLATIDVTAAVQAALDNNFGVFFPTGRYGVTSITIPNAKFIWFDGATIVGLGVSLEDAVVKLEGGSCQIYNMSINPNFSDNYTCALWWNNDTQGSQYNTVFALTINNARRGIVYGALPGDPATVPPMSENSLIGYYCFGVQNPWYGNAANGVMYIDGAQFVALNSGWPVSPAFNWANARAIENYFGLLFINNSEIVKSANTTGYTADLSNVNFNNCYFEFGAPIQFVGSRNRFTNCRLYQLAANLSTFYYPSNVAASEQYFVNCGLERPPGSGLTSATPMIDMSAVTASNAATNDITFDSCSLLEFNWQTASGYTPFVNNTANLKFQNTRYWRSDSVTDKYLLNNRSANLLVEAGKDYLGYVTTTWYPENGSGTAAVTIAADAPTGFNASSIQLVATGGTARAMTIDPASTTTVKNTGFQVKPGDLFSLSIWVKMPTGAASGGGIRALFYDTSGALVINDEVIDYLSLSGSDWTRIYARIAVPANAAFMGIASQASTDTIRITQVQLFRANNLT